MHRKRSPATMISSEERIEKKRAAIHGASMAYVEAGAGDAIVFLHGNPTSSYLWRNVIPHLESVGRCIAPDLIGMGDSDKLEPSGPDRYRFVEHRRFLDGLLDALGVVEKVVFVVHDWGAALGFDWARRHPDAVKGIAYMEGIVGPMEWDDFPDQIRPLFEALRSPAGEKMVLEENIFVEQVLPGAVLRNLSAAEMAVYRRPYMEPGEGRRPTLTWPRELPIGGEPAEVSAIVKDISEWLPGSGIPKLFINAKLGAILRGNVRAFCRTFANQAELTVAGSHFIQEDSPAEIGAAVLEWVQGIS